MVRPAAFEVEGEWTVNDPKRAVYLFNKGLKIRLIDQNLNSHSLSKVAKTDWLGGRLGKDRPDYVECQAVAALQNKFDKILAGRTSVPLWVGSFFIEDASSVGSNIIGSPKADFSINDSNGEEIFWVSYKSGGGSSALQNYSGLSPRSDLIDHPEVKEFFRDVGASIERATGSNAASAGMAFWKPLSCSLLLSRSIWGPDYRSPNAARTAPIYGRQAVQVVAQGAPFLQAQKDGSYRLSFSEGIWESGDISLISGDYKPVLGASYRSEECRGFEAFGKRFSNIRAGIYPRKYMTTRNSILL
jgi:hypothetical protein